jgi:hypothetical protein
MSLWISVKPVRGLCDVLSDAEIRENPDFVCGVSPVTRRSRGIEHTGDGRRLVAHPDLRYLSIRVLPLTIVVP